MASLHRYYIIVTINIIVVLASFCGKDLGYGTWSMHGAITISRWSLLQRYLGTVQVRMRPRGLGGFVTILWDLGSPYHTTLPRCLQDSSYVWILMYYSCIANNY